MRTMETAKLVNRKQKHIVQGVNVCDQQLMQARHALFANSLSLLIVITFHDFCGGTMIDNTELARTVRDYRHGAYDKWDKLVVCIRSLQAELDAESKRIARTVEHTASEVLHQWYNLDYLPSLKEKK